MACPHGRIFDGDDVFQRGRDPICPGHHGPAASTPARHASPAVRRGGPPVWRYDPRRNGLKIPDLCHEAVISAVPFARQPIRPRAFYRTDIDFLSMLTRPASIPPAGRGRQWRQPELIKTTLSAIDLTGRKSPSDHISQMRLFWVSLVIVILFAIDRAYMDGQNAEQVMSLARSAGGYITRGVDDLLRPLRR
jgi:hypothetical protein